MSTRSLTVAEIVRQYLMQHGFDGLACADAGCGCELRDLMPCDGPSDCCRPGYRAPCPPDCGDHDWHIVPPEETP